MVYHRHALVEYFVVIGVIMAKLSAAEIAKKVQGLYAPKDKAGRDIISTGADLKRPVDASDFVLVAPTHPWRTLTGLQGIPWDMVVQVAGAPDSGKSTLAGQVMAEAQKQGAYVILWDTEKKFDKTRYEKHFGGKADELNIVATTIIRKGAGAVFKYIKTIIEADPKAKILVVHDSVGGSISRARAEHEMDAEKDNSPGSEARENSDYMRHVIATFDKYPGQIALLLINQTTMRIGPVPGRSRSGGEKISFHSSLIVELNRIRDLTKTVKGVKVKTGIESRAKIAKNHLSQTENSVHEMRIMVDASGWHFVGGGDDNEEGTGEE
jgi:RecA/RadA recombinase